MSRLFVIALGLLIYISQPVKAADIDIVRAELQRLKEQVQALQSSVYESGPNPVAAQQEIRMQQLETQLSQITGQIENVSIRLDEVANLLDRMQKTFELRLKDLEQNRQSAVSQDSGSTGETGDGVGGGPNNDDVALVPPADTAGGNKPVQLVPLKDASSGTPEQRGQPKPLGTLTQDDLANLPTVPPSAADDAAQAAVENRTGVTDSGDIAAISDPKSEYDAAAALIKRGSYAQAEQAFRDFLKKYPKDALAGNAQYWLGESYYARDDYKTASIVFAEGYQKYPKSDKAPDNLLKLGLSLGKAGQKENACTALRQLDKQFPNASKSVRDRAVRAKKQYGCS